MSTRLLCDSNLCINPGIINSNPVDRPRDDPSPAKPVFGTGIPAAPTVEGGRSIHEEWRGASDAHGGDFHEYERSQCYLLTSWRYWVL